MDKRHKEIMNALVSKLRHILVGTPTDHGFEPGDLDRELERLGIDREGNVTPIDALADMHNGDGHAYRVAATQLQRLPENGKERRAARREIVERAAYTWINRLLALRAMEVRGLIDDTLRISEDYGGLSEKLYLLRLEQPASATTDDGGWWTVLRETCTHLAQALPDLFSLADSDAALHPTAGALLQCIDLLGGKQPVLPNSTLAELDAAFADPDAIGWAYQFYQTEAKSEIDAKCKSGGKAASRAELAAKTQLFTEPYMVQWLLQNSLGRSYVEAYPQSTLSAHWPYYIQPEADHAQPNTIFTLDQLTLLDPCMGSGHFLREAFDMFVAMYREQHPEMSALQIVNRILSHHLYGIDIDPRAAQLSEITLYLRAWEIVKAERRSGDAFFYIPPEMYLATTPFNLDRGALERHIQRYPDDIVYQPLLKQIFEGLEQADTLGSLLRSREYLDQAIRDLQQPHTVPLAFDQAALDLRNDVTALANTDPQHLRQILLDRIAASFHAEATRTDDVSMALFGREAERGVRLLQVLDGQYAVVATNPPYLGSKYMDDSLRKYVAVHYKAGKRDLYAAFILRCLQLCKSKGRVAMVTQHSWMFLRSFVELRAIPEEKSLSGQTESAFTGILRETSIEILAHLGEHAFEDQNAAGAFAAMFILAQRKPTAEHPVAALRLVGLKSANEKQTALLTAKKSDSTSIIATPCQYDFLSIPDAPLVYYLDSDLLSLLIKSKRVKEIAEIRQGLATADDNHFLRFTWEIDSIFHRWVTFTKGGGYCKWFGQNWYHVDWEMSGLRVRAFGKGRYQGINRYFSPGWSYSRISRGSIGIRQFDIPGCIGDKGPGIYTNDQSLIAIAQSHALAFILRSVSPQLAFEVNTIVQAPLPAQSSAILLVYVKLAELLKRSLISCTPIERNFSDIRLMIEEQQTASLLHTVEGIVEQVVCQDYQLTDTTIQTIIAETGTPAGWYPLIAGYDRLPELPDDLEDLPALPQELYDYLATHERITPDAHELTRIKANLRALYEAGPGAKDVELDDGGADEHTDEESESEEAIAGAYIPIPTETFLEELSVKIQVHPISVYWLLEELQATEMVRCLPEERRLLEDRLSVLILRLLGHRWPKQIEAFEPVPDWAERAGIIPLVAGTGHRTLAERIRERLHAEEGALGTQRLEALLHELTGLTLEEWLRTRFFEKHLSQFKRRPVAWHLTSTPPKRGTGEKKKRGERGGARTPAFECLLYYHVCAGDALARIRTQYVEPLLQSERGKIDTTALFTEDAAAAFVQERIRELEEFVARLRGIEEHGFACQELQEIVAEEILDRWSGNGYERPESKAAFQRGEEAWRVDINDGVRVNSAPLQLAGVLAKEVLNSKDAKKALGDRVRWRADERRWVRASKLPRCGWLEDLVPASEAWEQRAEPSQPQPQALFLPEMGGDAQEGARA